MKQRHKLAFRLVLQIGRAAYLVRVIECGFRLTKRNGKAYDVLLDPAGQVTCDCADAVYRERHCKHVRALIELGLFGEA